MTEPTPEPEPVRERAVSLNEVAAWCRQLGVPLTAELIAQRLTGKAGPIWDRIRAGETLVPAAIPPPCPICGELGACGYDREGRALIHVPVRERERERAEPTVLAPTGRVVVAALPPAAGTRVR